MKHLKLITAVIVFTLSINFSQAQEKKKLENSVLWKVEHADLKAPSYIMGTLHFMCEEDFNIPEKVKKTLLAVDALVLEVNFSDPTEIQAMQASMSNSKKISEEISKEQYDELDKLVTKVTGVSLVNYDTYGLSMLNSIMATKMLSCATFKSPETELTALTLASQKPIFSLEKAAQQIEIVQNAYPTEFAYKQLMLFESYKKDFNKAIQAYQNEDITSAVDLLTKEDYMDENATKLMQIDRNKDWVEKMPQMMKDRTNLFAVGAAHLTNDYGMIHLLRQKGYTVTPVIN